MAIVTNWPTSAALTGAQELNAMHLKAKQEDLGFKIEKLISAVNEIQLHVSTLQVVVSGVVSSMSTAAGASAFLLTASATGITSLGDLDAMTVTTHSNFRASHPA